MFHFERLKFNILKKLHFVYLNTHKIFCLTVYKGTKVIRRCRRLWMEFVARVPEALGACL